MAMEKKERREFRRSARRAARRAVREGTMTRLDRGRLLLKMRSDDAVDEMADVCMAQALECKVLSEEQAVSGDVDWQAVGEGVNWPKLAEFLMKILPMFI